MSMGLLSQRIFPSVEELARPGNAVYSPDASVRDNDLDKTVHAQVTLVYSFQTERPGKGASNVDRTIR